MIRSFAGAALVTAIGFITGCAEEPADVAELDFAEVSVEEQGLGSTTKLLATGDTHVRRGTPLSVHGSEPLLQVGTSDRRKALVTFSPAGILTALQNRSLVSARLVLRLNTPVTNVAAGQALVARPLTKPFAEARADYVCSDDPSAARSLASCPAAKRWNLDTSPFPWGRGAVPVPVANGATGTVSFNVTADLAAVQAGTLAPMGWIVMRTLDTQGGDMNFVSREGTYPPSLVIVTEPLPAVCGDGIVAGDEDCDDENAIETDGCFSDCSRAETFTAVTHDPFGPAGDVNPFMMQRPDGIVVVGTAFGAVTWNPQTTAAQFHQSPLSLINACHARLSDGRILVSGNGNQQPVGAEILNPATMTWTTTTAPATSRSSPSCAALPDGRALYLGGVNSLSALVAEVFNPATQQWAPQAWAGVDPSGTRAIQLSTGKLLFPIDTPMLFNPATMTNTAANVGFTANGNDGDAVLLKDGRVLVVTSRSASVFNPTTETWSTTAPQLVGRSRASLVVLPSGHVLASGGRNDNGSLATSAIYNPNVDAWAPSSSLNGVRESHGSLLLADGRVLVSGGNQIGDIEVLTLTP
jgi:cysteine-rich repeat protein